ncbi:hypothetical protein [Nocardioides litoris]|uniref:hypothetical protein n=1 Tax=Nocardioides litoris TaxID=1926648 RepID=UPI001B879A31|nr:hypothetical protein [Nocardioides litoris]
MALATTALATTALATAALATAALGTTESAAGTSRAPGHPRGAPPRRPPRGLDQLPPTALVARSTQHHHRIVAAAVEVERAEEELREAVRAAFRAGDSWLVVGHALGISRQAAHQRFGASSGPALPCRRPPSSRDPGPPGRDDGQSSSRPRSMA